MRKKISLLTSRLLAKNLVLPLLVCAILLAAGAATDVHAYRIRRVNTNLCLDGWSGYGNSPRLANCDSNNLNQQWEHLWKRQVGASIVMRETNLRNLSRGQCLDAYNYITQGPYALPYFANCDQSNQNQRWTWLRKSTGPDIPSAVTFLWAGTTGAPTLDGYTGHPWGWNYYPYLARYSSANENQKWVLE